MKTEDASLAKEAISSSITRISFDLGQVVVHLCIGCVTLQVLSINQGLDSFLKVRWFYWEPKLAVKLRNEQSVAQSLPGFHYPNNSGIDLVLPILKDAFGGGLVFLLRFLHLDVVDS